MGNGHGLFSDGGNECTTLSAGDHIVSATRNEKIIWIPNKARSSFCDSFDGKNSFRDSHFTYAIPLDFFGFYRLDDNRVLGVSANVPAVIIFKNDLTSPFFKDNKDFFVVDAEKINKAYLQCFYASDWSRIYPTDSELELTDKCMINFIRGEQK
jgi:hypothetical protein